MGEQSLDELKKEISILKEELRREQMLSRAITDTIPGPLYVLDEKGCYVRWNAYGRDKISGKPDESIKGMSVLDTVHPDDISLSIACIEDIVKNGSVQVQECRLLMHGGPEFKWFLLTAQRAVIDGRPFVVGVGIDITERKQAVLALQESEEKFSSFFSSMCEGVALHEVVCDQEGKPIDFIFLDVNPAFEKITGLKKSDIIGKSILAFLPHVDQAWVDKYGKVALTGVPAVFDDYFETVARYYHTVAFSPKKNQFAVIFSDVTESKMDQKALVFSNMVLRTQQEASIDGILVVDGNAKILSFNQRFVEMWQIPLELIESRDDGRVLEFVSSKLANPKEFSTRVKGLYESKSEISREEVVLKDGRVFDRYSAPMVSAEKKYYGRVWYFRDITESKRVQEKLENSMKELKLAQTHMISSEKMAGIGRLAAAVTHELRNPLMYITANIGLLSQYFKTIEEGIDHLGKELSGACTKAQEDYANFHKIFLKVHNETMLSINDAKEGCSRANEIVSGLLDYARVDVAIGQLIDLNCVIDKALEFVDSDIRYKCKVEKLLSPGVIVLGNQRELEQVFVNLFINASQAIEKNGLIKVESFVEGGTAVVRVQDNGAGIAQEDLSRLFEPFFTTKDDGQGTGLGLSIVHKIIERHGGDITVDSKVGEGTSFIIKLPVKNNNGVRYGG